MDAFWLFLFSSLCLVPVAFFWTCCCGVGQNCDGSCNSGTGPNEVTLTVSGVAGMNGACDCSQVNGTYVVPFVAAASGSCHYYFVATSFIEIFCQFTPDQISILDITLGLIPGHTGEGVNVQVRFDGGNYALRGAGFGSAPINCTAIFPVSCTVAEGSTGCDYSAVVCSVAL